MSADLAVHMYEIQVDTALKAGIDLAARTIQIVGEINEDSFRLLDTALTLLERDTEPVTIRINSEGGCVTDALAMVGRMQASTLHVVTEVYGIAHSAAIMLVAAGNHRRMSNLSSAMHHEGQYAVEGTHSAIKHAVKQAEREERAWNATMEQLCDAPEGFWAKKGKLGIDLYLDAKECLSLGVVDELF